MVPAMRCSRKQRWTRREIRSREGLEPSATVFRGAGTPAPLTSLLALSFGAIGLLGTIVLASLVAHEARERLEGEVGGQLAELAEHMAGNLDLGMFERWRDIQIAASLEPLRDPSADLASKHAVPESIHRTYPTYSLVALIGPDGRVLTTSKAS